MWFMSGLNINLMIWSRFKANPDFVLTFEARRISRNFLILLEGLLNKSPNTRPSCERISNAFKEGKVVLIYMPGQPVNNANFILARPVKGIPKTHRPGLSRPPGTVCLCDGYSCRVSWPSRRTD